jgi:hypothetical protein
MQTQNAEMIEMEIEYFLEIYFDKGDFGRFKKEDFQRLEERIGTKPVLEKDLWAVSCMGEMSSGELFLSPYEAPSSSEPHEPLIVYHYRVTDSAGKKYLGEEQYDSIILSSLLAYYSDKIGELYSPRAEGMVKGFKITAVSATDVGPAHQIIRRRPTLTKKLQKISEVVPL